MRKVTIFGLAGGVVASFGVEVIGSLVGSLTSSNSNYFSSLNQFAGSFGLFAIGAVVLGAIAANSLNIYTNSLSALVLDVRTKRWITVVIGGIVGLAITAAVGVKFPQFFENFLLTLDYWITPWLAMILVDFFVLRRTTTASIVNARSIDVASLLIYGLSIAVSAPFMVPLISVPYPLNFFVGRLSSLFGGADFSYFISFAIAAMVYFAYRRSTKKNNLTSAL